MLGFIVGFMLGFLVAFQLSINSREEFLKLPPHCKKWIIERLQK